MKKSNKNETPSPWQHLMDAKKQKFPQNGRSNMKLNNNRAPQRFQSKTRPGAK